MNKTLRLSIIKHTLEKVRELPTLPVVAHKVSMLLSDPNSSASELSEVITIDQSITAKILKLVNSACFALPQRVKNIKQAIGLLGYRNVSHIVLTLSVFDTLKKSNRSVFDRRAFWLHSIATAIMSLKIAKACLYRSEDDVFTAGLLHDIGKVFMDGFLHEFFCKIIDHAQENGQSFHASERALFDVDHAMIGEWMARSWTFPLLIIAVIKHHHQQQHERKGLVISSDVVVDFVNLADVTVRREGYGTSGDGKGFVPMISPELFRRLPISETDVNIMLESLKKDVENSKTLLDLAIEE
jgi:putative nucleotidyltransferase with HDIG domain